MICVSRLFHCPMLVVRGHILVTIVHKIAAFGLHFFHHRRSPSATVGWMHGAKRSEGRGRLAMHWRKAPPLTRWSGSPVPSSRHRAPKEEQISMSARDNRVSESAQTTRRAKEQMGLGRGDTGWKASQMTAANHPL